MLILASLSSYFNQSYHSIQFITTLCNKWQTLRISGQLVKVQAQINFKCKFVRQNTKYLGHSILEEGITINQR